MKILIISIILLITFMSVPAYAKNNPNYVNNNKYFTIKMYNIEDFAYTNYTVSSTKDGTNNIYNNYVHAYGNYLIIRSKRDSNGQYALTLPLRRPLNMEGDVVGVEVEFSIVSQSAGSYASGIGIVLTETNTFTRRNNGWYVELGNYIPIFGYVFDTRYPGVFLAGQKVYNSIVTSQYAGFGVGLVEKKLYQMNYITITLGSGGYSTSPYAEIKITKLNVWFGNNPNFDPHFSVVV